MAYKSFKPKNSNYIDTKGIMHNRHLLSDILYPVGSLYISVSSTSPATLFGGKWTQITGRFLYCSTTSKTTGGSNTHTLTVDEMPAHGHQIGQRRSDETAFVGYYAPNNGQAAYIAQWRGVTGDVDNYKLIARNTGGSKSHNNMPAYFTVYCWYRTA